MAVGNREWQRGARGHKHPRLGVTPALSETCTSFSSPGSPNPKEARYKKKYPHFGRLIVRALTLRFIQPSPRPSRQNSWNSLSSELVKKNIKKKRETLCASCGTDSC